MEQSKRLLRGANDPTTTERIGKLIDDLEHEKTEEAGRCASRKLESFDGIGVLRRRLARSYVRSTTNLALDVLRKFIKIQPVLPVGTASSMSFVQSKDARLLAFYENVRGQVELDKRSGGRYRFAGAGVKQYAERLREEIERRRLRFTPIDWNE